MPTPGELLDLVLGGHAKPAPSANPKGSFLGELLDRVAGGPDLDMSGQWVQLPGGGRVARHIYEQEQAHAQESAAQVEPGFQVSGEGPNLAPPGISVPQKAKLQFRPPLAVAGEQFMQTRQGEAVARAAGVLASPLIVPGQTSNALIQAGLEPIVDPDANPDFPSRFRENYVEPQVSKAMLETADGSLAGQASAAVSATLMDLADPEIVLGVPALARGVAGAARRKAIGAAIRDLAPSVPGAEARAMRTAAAEQAVGDTMSRARELGLNPSAKQVTDVGYQRRVLDLTEARKSGGPLEQLAERERQLAPTPRPAGPKTASELRRELRQVAKTPGELLDQVAQEAPAPVGKTPGQLLDEVSAPRAPEPEQLADLVDAPELERQLVDQMEAPAPARATRQLDPFWSKPKVQNVPVAVDGPNGPRRRWYSLTKEEKAGWADWTPEERAERVGQRVRADRGELPREPKPVARAEEPTSTLPAGDDLGRVDLGSTVPPVPDQVQPPEHLEYARQVLERHQADTEAYLRHIHESGMDVPTARRWLQMNEPPEVRVARQVLTEEVPRVPQTTPAPPAAAAPSPVVRPPEAPAPPPLAIRPPEQVPQGQPVRPGSQWEGQAPDLVQTGSGVHRLTAPEKVRWATQTPAQREAAFSRTAPAGGSIWDSLNAPPKAEGVRLTSWQKSQWGFQTPAQRRASIRPGFDFEPEAGQLVDQVDEVSRPGQGRANLPAQAEDVPRQGPRTAAELRQELRQAEPESTPRQQLEPDATSPVGRVGQDFEPRRAPQGSEPSYTVDGHQVHLGASSSPLPVPALVRLVKDVTGDVPNVSSGLEAMGKKMGGTIRGKVTGRRIDLNPAIFKDPVQAAKVLAHEIGHLPDWIAGAANGVVDSISAVRKRMRSWFKQMPEDVREELWQLSKEWRPIDEASVSPAQLRYRTDPEELFADAISRLFHDPDELAQRAPKFWKGFTDMLDATPALKQSVADVHGWRSGTLEDLVEGVRQEIATDLIKGENLFRVLQEEARARETSLLYRMGQNWYNQARELFTDTGGSLKAWADRLERNGLEVPESIDPRNTYDLWQMPDGATKQVLDGFNEDVLQPLRQAGLDEHTAGEWMQAQAIADGHRAGMANPKGVGPAEAAEQLRQIEAKLTPEQRETLKTTAEKTRAMFWDALEEGKDLYGEEALERLRAHKDSLTPMLELQKLHEGAKADDIVASLEAGSLRDAQNPMITMVQQVIAIRKWAHRNTARQATLDFVRYFEPGEVSLKAGAGREAFSVYRNGVKETVYVDGYLEDLFKVTPSREVRMLRNVLGVLGGEVGPAAVRGVFKFANAAMMNLWLRWNPAFYAAQGVMDVFRSSRNLAAEGLYQAWAPGNTLRVLRSYKDAWKDALSYARNNPNDLVSRMIDEHAILPPDLSLTNQLAGDQLGSMAQMDAVLHEAGIRTAQATQQGGKLRAVAAKMGDFWTALGRMSEALPKVAAYKELERAGFSRAQRARIVRTKIGQPAGYIKGRLTTSSGRVLAFANTIVQGLRSDAHLLRSPRTRSGFLVSALKHASTPKLLIAGAAAGLFGKELAEMYAAIPDRDKRNSIPIPLGWIPGLPEDWKWEKGGEFGRRVRYFNLPTDPTDKLFGAIIYEGLSAPGSGREAQDHLKNLKETLVDFVPGATPAIESGLALSDALTQDEPKDSGGRPIVSKDEAQAGLLPRLNGYVRWQLGQGGVLGQTVQAAVYRENLRQQTDWIPANVPFAARFFKVSDAGFAEQQRRGETLEQRGQARNRISYGANVRELRQQYSRLQKLGIDKRTPQQEEAYGLLKDWHDLYDGQNQEIQSLDPAAARAARQSLERQSESYMQQFQRLTGRKW